MKASVVMPVYNRCYIVADALRSILEQTFTDFEAVVVDDGSTDETARIVSSFRDARIRLVCHERNRGYSAACNTGIREARAEYVSMLDSDDVWKPQKLAREIKFLEQHPGVGGVFSDLEKWHNGKHIPSFTRKSPAFARRFLSGVNPAGQVLSRREMYLCLLEETPIKPSAFTAKTEGLRRAGGFDESLPSGSDCKLYLEFVKRYEVGYIDEAMTVMRVQDDATHFLFREKDLVCAIARLRGEGRTIRDDAEASAACRRGIIETTKSLGWFHGAEGRPAKAAEALWSGFLQTYSAGLAMRSVKMLLSAARATQHQVPAAVTELRAPAGRTAVREGDRQGGLAA